MANRSVYPASVDGELSEELSSRLWLVKWLLIIPRFVVLFFLWIAFTAETVAAIFVIVFTGRYPRGVFKRWSFRVPAYAALMRDEYPPFRLSP